MPKGRHGTEQVPVQDAAGWPSGECPQKVRTLYDDGPPQVRSRNSQPSAQNFNREQEVAHLDSVWSVAALSPVNVLDWRLIWCCASPGPRRCGSRRAWRRLAEGMSTARTRSGAPRRASSRSWTPNSSIPRGHFDRSVGIRHDFFHDLNERWRVSARLKPGAG